MYSRNLVILITFLQFLYNVNGKSLFGNVFLIPLTFSQIYICFSPLSPFLSHLPVETECTDARQRDQAAFLGGQPGAGPEFREYGIHDALVGEWADGRRRLRQHDFLVSRSTPLRSFIGDPFADRFLVRVRHVLLSWGASEFFALLRGSGGRRPRAAKRE